MTESVVGPAEPADGHFDSSRMAVREEGMLDCAWWRRPPGEDPTPLARPRPPVPLPVPGRAAHVSPPSPGFATSQSTATGRARDMYGRVMLWKARTVDVDGLLALLAVPELPLQKGESPEENGGAGSSAGQGPAVNPLDDDLLRRLFEALQPPPAALLSAAGPLAWPGPLFSFQLDGVRALLQSTHLLLADDMGLGKTVQALAALRILILRHELDRALIVAPASLLEQWRRELQRWAPELRVMVVHGAQNSRAWRWRAAAHVMLTSYETLRSDVMAGSASGPCRQVWGVVVLDEAQKIRNRETDVAQACKRLPRRRSWALTGTPLENRVEDVISILEYVSGEGTILSPLYKVRSLLEEYQLRRRKKDVLQDLPPRLVTRLALRLGDAQRWAYDRAEKEGLVALQSGGEVRMEHVLGLITRLKQICNFDQATAESAKLDDLSSRLDELKAEGHKAIVFTQFVDDTYGARRLMRGLERFSPVAYTGSMDLRQRDRAVEQFHQDASRVVMVISLRAGALGLNLQNASYVFHFDRWWNPSVEQQAEARVHRMGQRNPTHVYQYVMAGTIEERIADILEQKQELFQAVVEDASMDVTRLLDRRDLLRMVGLPAG